MALIVDFSRVLLFPKDSSYRGSLNQLHKERSVEGDYSLLDHFYLNTELLGYLDSKKDDLDLSIFTSDIIQDSPELQPSLSKIFKNIFSASKLSISKQNSDAYLKLLQLLNLKTNEVIYVDDSKGNVDAAKKAGLVTVLYEDNATAIEEIEILLSGKDFNYNQYQNNYEQYLESNESGQIGGKTPAERVELLSRYLTKGSHIFEVGSGGGDDAQELVKQGYSVTTSDYVEKFVELLKSKKLNAVVFDAKKDSIPQNIDAIYANAVFVHFSPQELKGFLKRSKDSLTGPKLIFLTVIKGEGYERSARARGFERDFYYYNLNTLSELLSANGYKILDSDSSDPKWLQVITSVS